MGEMLIRLLATEVSRGQELVAPTDIKVKYRVAVIEMFTKIYRLLNQNKLHHTN